MAPSRSRALVVVGSPRAEDAPHRPLALFVTQLIACARNLPAYRRSVRAEPRTATSAYGRSPAGPAASLNLTV